MTRLVTIDEAQIHLSDLVEAVKNGETILIAQNNQPVVQMVAVHAAKRHAQFGSAAGLLVVAADFDAPLPDLAEYAK
jgi:prevent-host-death family protein